jgi:hypothetical protein
MEFILNIGLAVGATPSIAAHVALEIVKANDFIVKSHTVAESDTEPTVVATVTYLGVNALMCLQHMRAIADDLQQDCIAVYRPLTGKGALIGPKAAAWGAFNPEFFIMPDGTRLASPAVSQAA